MSFLSVTNEHIGIITQLQQQEALIQQCSELISNCLLSGGKLLLMGNGGSAADAQHIATEFIVRYSKETKRRALPAIALTTDSSILTACSNDFDFEFIFQRQIEALAQPGDLVIGISTSGNSKNVVKGLLEAKNRGAESIGLTGIDGGEIAKIADSTVEVPSSVTSRIQEAHILIGHFWCEQTDKKFAIIDGCEGA